MHRDRAAAGKGQCHVFVDRLRGRYRVDRRGVAIADNDIEAIGGRGIAGSVAVTFTVTVPTSLFPGVPEKVYISRIEMEPARERRSARKRCAINQRVAIHVIEVSAGSGNVNRVPFVAP